MSKKNWILTKEFIYIVWFILYCNFRYIFICQIIAKRTSIVKVVSVKSTMSSIGPNLKIKMIGKDLLLKTSKDKESFFNKELHLENVCIVFRSARMIRNFCLQLSKNIVQQVNLLLLVTMLMPKMLEKYYSSRLSCSQLKLCLSDQNVWSKFTFIRN